MPRACFGLKTPARTPYVSASRLNSSETMKEKSLRLQELGADGLLLITPYYNKTNEEGMYRHFKTVLDTFLPRSSCCSKE